MADELIGLKAVIDADITNVLLTNNYVIDFTFKSIVSKFVHNNNKHILALYVGHKGGFYFPYRDEIEIDVINYNKLSIEIFAKQCFDDYLEDYLCTELLGEL